MKITPKMLDSTKETQTSIRDFCWWEQELKDFTPPKTHKKQLISYLVFGISRGQTTKTNWLVTLCSSCAPTYKKNYKDLRITKLSAKDLFYLKINENNY